MMIGGLCVFKRSPFSFVTIFSNINGNNSIVFLVQAVTVKKAVQEKGFVDGQARLDTPCCRQGC